MDAVRSGERIAGRLEQAAVQRFLDDRDLERSGESPYVFNEALADRACRFFPLLRHSDGQYFGQRFHLYPWQVFVVRNLFGWVHRDSGLRRFNEAFLSVGRGNGKSPFGAALMLLLFQMDYPEEARAEVYTTAVKRDQAAISFNAAKRFVESSPSLVKKITIHNKKLLNGTHSNFEPLSSDASSADGHNIHGLLRDELHEWSELQREYYDKLASAMAKRRQPLAITITTAGSERSRLWRENYSFACKVADPDCPLKSDNLFVFICEIDEEDDELDEQVWPKANPMLEYGVVKIGALRDMAAKAIEDPATRRVMRRYHCNRLAYTEHKSFTAEVWAKGDQAIPYGEIKEVFTGVDLGMVDDLAAVGVVAPLDWVSVEGKSKRRYAVWCHSWIPAGTKRNLTHEPFATFVSSDRVMVTDSEWTDTAYIYREVEDLNNEYGVRILAYDPAMAREFALNCVNEIGIEVFPFNQQHGKYNEPLLEFKQALSEGRILHGGDPLLGWAALNVVEDVNIKGHAMPSKHKAEEKIDPFVAVLMAFSEALFAERTKRKLSFMPASLG
jgi:phage terminase large subunit-like protein